jgi:hypothetical protein
MINDLQKKNFCLAGIVSTMKSKAGPAYRVLNTLADYEKFLEYNDYGIVGTLF